jgi:sulfonate transport system ATP-binding protein
MEKIIELSNLYKSFNNERVIEDLNYSFFSNEIVVLLGYSGVGKSTLLRIISGLDHQYQGEVTYASDINISKSVIPIVFQSFDQLLPWYTVKKNILLPYKKKNNKLKLFNEIIEILDLEDALNKYPKELSGGMKQRTAIARALLAETPVILFDEPFSSLDISMRQSLQELILKIQRKFHQTIIFVTHDIEEAVFLGDRLLIMKTSKNRQHISLHLENKERYTEPFDHQVRHVIKIIEGSNH